MKDSPAARSLSVLLAVLAGSVLAWSAPVAGEQRVTFTDSLAPLPNVAGTKAASASPLVASSVQTLSARQLAAPMEFSVAMGMRNLAEFQARIASGELVPDAAVQAKYLPLQADFDRVAAWLKSEGFTPTADDTSRLSVFVQGTPAQIQRSFGVTMQSVTVDGETFTAATTAPSLPASVSAGVRGVNGLQPYIRMHPHHRNPPAAAAKPGGVQTNSVSSPNQPPFLISEIRNAYNGGTLTSSGTVLDGTGQKIAIVIDTFAAHSDLVTFWGRNGVHAGVTVDNIGTVVEESAPGATPSAGTDAEEATLDEEWSSGIAPGAVVRVYRSGNLGGTNLDKCYAQIQKEVRPDTNGVIAQPNLHAMSMSYGGNEYSTSPSAYATDAGYYATIANGNTTYGGVTIFASSGDSGSQPSGGSYLVEYPASDLSLTAVGGTDLYYSPTAVNGRNWTEKGWGEVSAFSDGSTGFGGSGGGTSIAFTRPAWQTGSGVPTGSKRLVPDVSAAGGPTYGDLQFNGQATGVYGTSWSSPTWAGFAALFNQARKLQGRLPLGLLNPRVYPLVGSANFYDVTTGNNSYTSSTTTGATGTGNYNCTAGYDEVTGLGTPNLTALVSALSGPTVTGFIPTNGAAGTSVIITGTNFYTSASSALAVKFNGIAATVTAVSPTQVTVTVPGGTASGPVVVTSLGDAATSATSFSTTAAPDARIVAANPSSVSQGDNGDPFVLTVSNVGSLAASGTTTVTLAQGPGLYIASMSGTGWTCTAGISGSPVGWTCTRTGSLAGVAGGVVSSFPTLTASVNVSPTASTAQGGSLTGHVVVSGDTNSANDYSYDTFAINAATTTALQQWRYNYFHTTASAGNAADTANPAGDGLGNLTKYALGLDPTMAEASPFTEDTGTGFLQLSVPRTHKATDVTYSVQVTSDLTNPGSWTTDGTTIIKDTDTLLQVRDSMAVGSTPKRFIRLQVSH